MPEEFYEFIHLQQIHLFFVFYQLNGRKFLCNNEKSSVLIHDIPYSNHVPPQRPRHVVLFKRVDIIAYVMLRALEVNSE